MAQVPGTLTPAQEEGYEEAADTSAERLARLLAASHEVFEIGIRARDMTSKDPHRRTNDLSGTAVALPPNTDQSI